MSKTIKRVVATGFPLSKFKGSRQGSIEQWRQIVGTGVGSRYQSDRSTPTSAVTALRELVLQQLTMRGLPKYLQVVQDISFCGLGCGLENPVSHQTGGPLPFYLLLRPA